MNWSRRAAFAHGEWSRKSTSDLWSHLFVLCVKNNTTLAARKLSFRLGFEARKAWLHSSYLPSRTNTPKERQRKRCRPRKEHTHTDMNPKVFLAHKWYGSPAHHLDEWNSIQVVLHYKQLLDGSVLIAASLTAENIFILIPVRNLKETCFAYRHECVLLIESHCEWNWNWEREKKRRWRKKSVCACVCRTSSHFISSTQHKSPDTQCLYDWQAKMCFAGEETQAPWSLLLTRTLSLIPYSRLCYFASLLFLLNGLMLLLLGWLSACDAMPCHCYCCSSPIFTSLSLFLALHRRHNKMNRIVINLILKKLSLKAFKCSPNENRAKYEAIPLLLQRNTIFSFFFFSLLLFLSFRVFVMGAPTRVTHFPAMLSSSSTPPVDVLWHVAVVSHSIFETAHILNA